MKICPKCHRSILQQPDNYELNENNWYKCDICGYYEQIKPTVTHEVVLNDNSKPTSSDSK